MLKQTQDKKKHVEKTHLSQKDEREIGNGEQVPIDKDKKRLNKLSSKLQNKKENKDEDKNEFKEKYLKARSKTIDLFGRHIDSLRLKNKIKEQRDKIERQKTKIELSYKRARKRTIDLYGKNTDLKKAKRRIEFQQAELVKSNSSLEQKSKEISSSIDYAKKIQEAILPTQNDIKKQIRNFFILFKPRDIVSGDFYWFHKTGNKIYIAVADCTGHGVPGAFMSMISATLLNSIIIDEQFYSPALILKELNQRITESLKQDSIDNEQSADGMDISLCCINIEKKEFEISSANQDAYLFCNNNLISIESDLFSVGGNLSFRVQPEYTNQHFLIKEDSKLYFLSDGFKDQFGGEKNKKFGIKPLKELLIKGQEYSMQEQKDFYSASFAKWKGDFKQLDDVLLLGIDLNSVVE